MKPNRLPILMSLSLAMLSSGKQVAAMQSLPTISGNNQTCIKTVVGGLVATGAMIGSALYARTYLHNPKMNKPQQEVPAPKNIAEIAHDCCQSDIAPKVKELQIVPTAIADLIAGYAAVEPKPIKRAPYYNFSGMRPTR